MPFTYSRTVRFADTDAAGIVYFANYLSLCHEAYEESLAAGGIDLGAFFRDTGLIVPIAKSEAEYLRPLGPGDKLRIALTAERLTEHSYTTRYEIHRLGRPEKLAARIRLEHVASSPAKRERVPLPPALVAWLESTH